MGDLNYTVSGDIASFRTPSRVPIESLKLHFLPKQAAGTPSPENPIPIEGWTGLNGYHTGINLFSNNFTEQDPDNISYSNTSKRIFVPFTYAKGMSYSNYVNKDNITTFEKTNDGFQILSRAGYGVGFAFPLKSGKTYRCKFTKSGGGIVDVAFYAKDGTYLGYQNSVEDTPVTVPTNAVMSVFVFRSTNTTQTATITNIYLFENGAMSSYKESRGNDVIPITFPVAGTNKLDPSAILNNHGHFSLNNGIWSNVVTDERTYIQLAVQLWKSTGTYIKTLYVDYVKTTGRHVLTFTVDDSNGHYICLKHNGTKKDFILLFPWTFGLHQYTISLDVLSADPTTIGGVQLTNIQLEPGDTAHAFEPYSSDNTFYGGYIDPVAGEIVAEYEMIADAWKNWTLRGTALGNKVKTHRFNNLVNSTSGGGGICISNVAQKMWKDTEESNPHFCFTRNTSTVPNYNNVHMFLPEDLDENTVIQVLATLETPIHIPIPTEDLKAFLDHNNFWSNANDITEVTYSVIESKDILAIQKKAQSFNDYFQGELVFELNGDDAPVDGKWIERVNGWGFELLGDAAYDSVNKVYDFSGCSLAATSNENAAKLNMGHHFRIEWDLYYKRKLSNSSIFFDIGSLTSADKALGIGLLTKSDNSTISFNWKMLGNSSNPWSGVEEIRESPVVIPMDDVFTHLTGFHEIIPSNDGYDRARVKVNNKIKKYITPVPKVLYSGPWSSQIKTISIGAGVYNIAALRRGSTGDNSYYCECKIKSIKIYKYD